ncbi:MAG: matrixin family metalloprotease [Candidatus Obscuribacterales bacterium]|nr:matrixin family metalloprotease [Candidatus Obscuribacterales bacterium]
MIKITLLSRQVLLPLFFMLTFTLSSTSTALAVVSESKNDSGADNYISDIEADGLYSWGQNKLPLKVYFQPGNNVPAYRTKFKEILISCFDEWSQVSNGQLDWTEVTDPQAADILVSWSDQAVEASQGTEAGKTRTYAHYNQQTNHGKIDRAEMRLLTRLPEREFSESEVKKAYLHEVGHAFGIVGHSTNPNDIMYFAVSKKQGLELTQRDKATLNYLYTPAAI